MTFPKTLAELEDKIVKIWRATIDSIKNLLGSTIDRVEVTEEDISTLEEDVEELDEELLATKAEVLEIKELLGILVFELTEMGVKIQDPRLIQLIEDIEYIY